MNFEVLHDRVLQLANRIKGYPRHEVVVELVVIWVVMWLVLHALRGTRGARAVKGMTLILTSAALLIQLLVRENTYERLNHLYNMFLFGAAIAMVVVFQPELRRALVRLGEARIFFGRGHRGRVIDEVVAAVTDLSKDKIGALIAIERSVPLKGIVEGGVKVDSVVTKELLQTIFTPTTPLHDMGVLIQEERLAAAGVQFPLAEGERYGTELGSRHRAAIGLSQEADALIVVVSEETGKIGLAQRGRLERGLTPESLRAALLRGLSQAHRWPWRWLRAWRKGARPSARAEAAAAAPARSEVAAGRPDA